MTGTEKSGPWSMCAHSVSCGMPSIPASLTPPTSLMVIMVVLTSWVTGRAGGMEAPREETCSSPHR